MKQSTRDLLHFSKNIIKGINYCPIFHISAHKAIIHLHNYTKYRFKSNRLALETLIGYLDPDPACHLDVDPNPAFQFDADPDPGFQIKAQNLEKLLK